MTDEYPGGVHCFLPGIARRLGSVATALTQMVGLRQIGGRR